MIIFGINIDIVGLLMVFCGFVVVIILYMAYKINKLKKLEVKLELIEHRLEREVRGLKPASKRKKRRR